MRWLAREPFPTRRLGGRGVAVGVGLAVGRGVGLAVGRGVGRDVGVGRTVAVGATVAVGVPVTAGLGAGEALADGDVDAGGVGVGLAAVGDPQATASAATTIRLASDVRRAAIAQPGQISRW